MTRRRHTVLSAVPLMAACGRRRSASEVALRLGVSERTVSRWRAGGTIRPWEADRLAVRLGMHPAEVWGDDWWIIAA